VNEEQRTLQRVDGTVSRGVPRAAVCDVAVSLAWRGVDQLTSGRTLLEPDSESESR
jgi:hypothetical protein